MIRISVNSFPLRNLANLKQSAIVPKGKQVRVFYLNLPESIVCFIYRMSVSRAKWKWIIDGEEIDFNLEAGKMYRFDPPFLVKHYMELYAENDTDMDIVATVFCDGICYKEITIEQKVDFSEVINSLKEIKNALDVKSADGKVFDKKVVISDTIKMLYEEDGLNWTACNITNAGPDSVYIAVNKWTRPETPLLPGLTTNIDLGKKGAIKKIYLVCDKGKKATVYIRVLK